MHQQRRTSVCVIPVVDCRRVMTKAPMVLSVPIPDVKARVEARVVLMLFRGFDAAKPVNIAPVTTGGNECAVR